MSNEEVMIQTWISACRYMLKYKSHKDEVYHDLVILACGQKSFVYHNEMREIIFSSRDVDSMNKFLDKMRRDGFIKKTKKSQVYFSLTERGQRHYWKIVAKVNSVVWNIR